MVGVASWGEAGGSPPWPRAPGVLAVFASAESFQLRGHRSALVWSQPPEQLFPPRSGHSPKRADVQSVPYAIQRAVCIQCRDVVGEECVVIKHTVLEQNVANYFTLH